MRSSLMEEVSILQRDKQKFKSRLEEIYLYLVSDRQSLKYERI